MSADIGGDAITLALRLDEAHYRALHAVHARHLDGWRWYGRVMPAVGALAGAWMLGAIATGHAPLALLGGPPAVLAGFEAWHAPRRRAAWLETRRRDRRFDTTATLALDAQGLRHRGVEGEARVAWSALDRVREVPEGLCLGLGKAWRWIPRDAVASAEDWARLQGWIAAAREAEAPRG